MLNASHVHHLYRTGLSAVDYREPLPKARKSSKKKPDWDDLSNRDKCDMEAAAAMKHDYPVKPCVENGCYDYDDCNAGDYCKTCSYYDRENDECRY